MAVDQDIENQIVDRADADDGNPPIAADEWDLREDMEIRNRSRHSNLDIGGRDGRSLINLCGHLVLIRKETIHHLGSHRLN